MSDRVHRITSMNPGAPREGGPETDATERAAGLERGLDRLLSIQRPIVVAHLRGIRRSHPTASPDELVRILERRYLTAVTTGGAAVGATAVVPGIGTGVTLALSGVETAGFLEATALFAQSVAELHGLHVENPDRARALVMTLLMGREGVDLVRQFASQATGMGVPRNAYWGEVITSGLPKAVMGTVADRLRRLFIRQFAVRGSAGIIGRAIPFGIGAAIGGVGNHVLGRRVLQQARLAFGAPPQLLPVELEPREPGAAAVVRAGRRGAAFGTAVIAASSRGLRTAGRAIGRRRGSTDAATGAVEPPVPNPSPTPPDGVSPPAA